LQILDQAEYRPNKDEDAHKVAANGFEILRTVESGMNAQAVKMLAPRQLRQLRYCSRRAIGTRVNKNGGENK